MKLPAGLTLDVVMDAVERSSFGLDNVGFCLDCGEEYNDCEPDCENRSCDRCGCDAVCGAEEILIRIA